MCARKLSIHEQRNQFLHFVTGVDPYEFYLAASDLKYSLISLGKMMGCTQYIATQMQRCALGGREIDPVIHARPVLDGSFDEIVNYARSMRTTPDWSAMEPMIEIFKTWSKGSMSDVEAR